MDDLGYGDLSVTGHPTIHTPNIDRLAAGGQLWTNFYVASSVCSPSRAALLTGRYPVKNGVWGKRNRVFFPDSKGGLPPEEVTLAELLKDAGYATGIIGKWHLGHEPRFLPTRQGFDYYYGIPYSNDMDAIKWSVPNLLAKPPDTAAWKVPLMRNDSIIERPADQYSITRRYTERAVDFIDRNADVPFFLYLPHSMVHTPLFVGEEFGGSSPRGYFGDVMAEVDWSVGRVLEALEKHELTENTLVIFTSDNGPWLSMKVDGGSAGLLRDGKGTTWEGGMRVPTIFSMPGTVTPGRVTGIGATLDVLPTVAAMVGITVPENVDGIDLGPALRGLEDSPRETMIYYRKSEVYAIRSGPYKAHFVTETCYTPDNDRREYEIPLLFNLLVDPGERYDIAADHPEIVAGMIALRDSWVETTQVSDPQLDLR